MFNLDTEIKTLNELEKTASIADYCEQKTLLVQRYCDANDVHLDISLKVINDRLLCKVGTMQTVATIDEHDRMFGRTLNIEVDAILNIYLNGVLEDSCAFDEEEVFQHIGLLFGEYDSFVWIGFGEVK